MLNPDHVRRFVLVPALADFPESMRTDNAIELLLGTALKESGLVYLKQSLRKTGDGRGRALGLWQMEPATYQSHVDWLNRHPELGTIIFPHGMRPATDMQGDLYFAARMARIHYWARASEPLPEINDIESMAAYWSKWYNTKNLLAEQKEFIRLYKQHA